MTSSVLLVCLLFAVLAGVSGSRYLGCYREISSTVRLLPGEHNDIRGLTNDKCIEYCRVRNYRYAATQWSYECFCSKTRPPYKAVAEDSDCDSKCEGNANEICGGGLRLSVHDIEEMADSYVELNEVGCFSNSADNQLLRGMKTESEKLVTPEYCTGFCYGLGYRYAGLQAGKQCFCGGTLDASRQVDSEECNSQCLADDRRVCGGDWRVSVYQTGLPDVAGNKYLGCYKDPVVTDRLLAGHQHNMKTTLTNQRCMSVCKDHGFRYAGTQYEIECFCGKTRPPFQSLVPEEDCQSRCAGDSKQKCGGNFRVSVYDITGGGDNPVLNLYQACYHQSKGIGNSFKITGDKMTPEKCVAHCWTRGFRFAGVQAGRECVCGDVARPDGVAKAEQCSAKCSGDPALRCGGPAFTGVYVTGVPDIPLNSKRYMGCFKDEDLKNRVLSGTKLDFPETNTPKRCQNVCLALAGYKYSGTQYGKECFCGNRRPDVELLADDSECQQPCSGDRKQFCGGGYKLLVYATGGTGSLAPVTTTNTVQPPTKCDPSVTVLRGKPACKGEVIFNEEFSANTVNTDSWSYSVLMPLEPDYEFTIFDNNPKNVYVKNGRLYIKPSLLSEDVVRKGKKELPHCTAQQYSEECSRQAVAFSIIPPVQSARINTKESLTFKYGTITIRAKMPQGDWLKPELLLVPTRMQYGPGYSSGTVRLGMTRGNKDLTSNGADISGRHLEAGVLLGLQSDVKEQLVTKDKAEGWSKDFHNYTLRWTPDNMYFRIDNEPEEQLVPTNSGRLCELLGFGEEESNTWSAGSNIAPFDKEFYISLGLTAGGMRDFPDGSVSGPNQKPWKNNAVKAMLNFWQSRDKWEPTWEGEEAALQVESVKVTAL